MCGCCHTQLHPYRVPRSDWIGMVRVALEISSPAGECCHTEQSLAGGAPPPIARDKDTWKDCVARAHKAIIGHDAQIAGSNRKVVHTPSQGHGMNAGEISFLIHQLNPRGWF